jgi:hypothetical protein
LIKNHKNFFLLLIIGLLVTTQLYSQDTTKSLAFKKNRPYKNSPYYYQPDLSYQLLHQFKLVQIANSGDPLAQHELGLRLLTGEGMAPDTIAAAYWIKKAASQKLSAAQYNYGILLINGIGTEWNPFLAFDNFLSAAESGMSQAQYVVGILYTDNLIVQQNWNKSYYWIKKSFDGGFEPAKEALTEITPKVSKAFIDSVGANKFTFVKQDSKPIKDEDNIQPSVGLVFIDFTENQDTTREVSDKILIQDLERTEIKNILDTLGFKLTDSLLTLIKDKKQLNILNDLAEAGSPEALSILGRLYEKGIYFETDLLKAAEYYVRASILDSHRSAYLLWQLARQNKFLENLRERSQNDDPVAEFVWFGLTKLGYDNQLAESDAFNLLSKSASKNHIPALIEYGYSYYTGKYFATDKSRGLKIWESAKNLGSIESEVRIITSKIYDDPLGIDQATINSLINFSDKGSLLAQVALAHCYENGIGIKKNSALASKYYRIAAQRGSQFAYGQLRRIYDDLRPASEKYRVSN